MIEWVLRKEVESLKIIISEGGYLPCFLYRHHDTKGYFNLNEMYDSTTLWGIKHILQAAKSDARRRNMVLEACIVNRHRPIKCQMRVPCRAFLFQY